MPQLSSRSLQRLGTCAFPLQQIALEAIKLYDFTVLSGYRGRDEQQHLVAEGLSRLPYPRSKHNSTPSLAIDVAPYPIDWNNSERFYLLAGIFFTIAHQKNINLRWGGDWNCNWNFSDQEFTDLPHFELVI